MADQIPKAPGQRVGMSLEHDLVRCCFAVTCLMNAGDNKEQATRHIAEMMKQTGIP